MSVLRQYGSHLQKHVLVLAIVFAPVLTEAGNLLIESNGEKIQGRSSFQNKEPLWAECTVFGECDELLLPVKPLNRSVPTRGWAAPTGGMIGWYLPGMYRYSGDQLTITLWAARTDSCGCLVCQDRGYHLENRIGTYRGRIPTNAIMNHVDVLLRELNGKEYLARRAIQDGTGAAVAWSEYKLEIWEDWWSLNENTMLELISFFRAENKSGAKLVLPAESYGKKRESRGDPPYFNDEIAPVDHKYCSIASRPTLMVGHQMVWGDNSVVQCAEIFGTSTSRRGEHDGIRVYESTLSERAVLVNLSPEKVAMAVASEVSCQQIGHSVAEKMLGLAGIPESITGKVAAMLVCETLCLKYKHDIQKAVKDITKGNSVTLKYYVNLEGVRDLWRLSDEVGDDLMPLDPYTKTVLKIANELVNTRLE